MVRRWTTLPEFPAETSDLLDVPTWSSPARSRRDDDCDAERPLLRSPKSRALHDSNVRRHGDDALPRDVLPLCSVARRDALHWDEPWEFSMVCEEWKEAKRREQTTTIQAISARHRAIRHRIFDQHKLLDNLKRLFRRVTEEHAALCGEHTFRGHMCAWNDALNRAVACMNGVANRMRDLARAIELTVETVERAPLGSACGNHKTLMLSRVVAVMEGHVETLAVRCNSAKACFVVVKTLIEQPEQPAPAAGARHPPRAGAAATGSKRKRR